MDRTSADTPGNAGKAGWSGSAVLDSLTNHCRVFLFSYSPAARALHSFSANAGEVLGVKDIAITGSGNLFLRHVHPDDRFRVLQDLERGMRGEKEYRATYRWIRPDTHEECWLHCRGELVTRASEALFEGMIVDLSDEIRNLPSSAVELSSQVVGALPGTLFTLDTELRIGFVSRPLAASAFRFGDENFRLQDFSPGKPFLECFSSAELRSRFEQLALDLLEGRRKEFHERSRIKDGPSYDLALLPVDENGICPGLVGVIRDVSAPVQLEDRVAQLERLEGVRALLNGVSHHLNNALQGILGQADIIFHNAHRPEVVQQASHLILESAQRTSALSRQVFEDSTSQSDAILTPCDLNVALMKALHSDARLASGKIKVALALGAAAPILATPARLGELLREVLEWAAATTEPGTPLQLKTFETSFPRPHGQALKAGRYVELVISHGPAAARTGGESAGSAEAETPRSEIQSRQGKISALAQALCGELRTTSPAHAKLTAVLLLPVALPAASIPAAAEVAPQPGNATATVMVVDDDAMVLETIAAILRENGWRCLTASSAEVALEHVKKNGPIDLVLVDAIMPGTDGVRLVRKLKRLHPSLKVVGFSGAPAEYAHALREAGASQVLSKPLDPSVLKRLVREILSPRVAA